MKVYCAVCDKYVDMTKVRIVISRYGTDVEVDHEHRYLFLVERGVVVSITEESEKLVKVLMSVRRV